VLSTPGAANIEPFDAEAKATVVASYTWIGAGSARNPRAVAIPAVDSYAAKRSKCHPSQETRSERIAEGRSGEEGVSSSSNDRSGPNHRTSQGKIYSLT
jgi:hypothetical protein